MTQFERVIQMVRESFAVKEILCIEQQQCYMRFRTSVSELPATVVIEMTNGMHSDFMITLIDETTRAKVSAIYDVDCKDLYSSFPYCDYILIDTFLTEVEEHQKLMK